MQHKGRLHPSWVELSWAHLLREFLQTQRREERDTEWVGEHQMQERMQAVDNRVYQSESRNRSSSRRWFCHRKRRCHTWTGRGLRSQRHPRWPRQHPGIEGAADGWGCCCCCCSCSRCSDSSCFFADPSTSRCQLQN